MRLLHFAKESYCAYRFKGLPLEVATIKTKMESYKYLIVTCYKEQQVPTEADMNDFQVINSDSFFEEIAEDVFQSRVNNKPNLKVLN